MKTLLLGLASALTVLGLACDEDPAEPPLGAVTIEASAAPSLASGFTTADGWAVKYTRFLVSVTQVSVAGSEGTVTASNANLVVDLAKAHGPVTLVSAENRIARAWQDVSLAIGPATSGASPTPPLGESDVAPLVTNGLSVYVEATMQKDTVTKTLELGFATNTTYARCGSGVVIPRGGTATADVGFAGDVLFADALSGAHVLRGDAIAAADGNDDGLVSLAELDAVSILSARAAGGAYTTGGPDPATLGAFVTLEVPAIVASFGGDGTCAVAPAGADAGAP